MPYAWTDAKHDGSQRFHTASVGICLPIFCGPAAQYDRSDCSCNTSPATDIRREPDSGGMYSEFNSCRPTVACLTLFLVAIFFATTIARVCQRRHQSAIREMKGPQKSPLIGPVQFPPQTKEVWAASIILAPCAPCATCAAPALLHLKQTPQYPPPCSRRTCTACPGCQ